MAARAGTSKELRSGYTTGACAAAAAKAAVLGLLGRPHPGRVEIPFPDGSRHSFELCRFAHALFPLGRELARCGTQPFYHIGDIVARRQLNDRKSDH